ncbi:MAG: hypothetical protein PUB17_09570 [Lachnospiraceae bacterium]|nr:hypothetical protein [Lachnospiraceae bacterium]
MPVQVLTAIVSAAATIMVCVITTTCNLAAMKKQRQEMSVLVDYKITELTKRVDKHNNIIDRTYKLEEKTEVQAEQIKVVNHRIADLEGAVNR